MMIQLDLLPVFDGYWRPTKDGDTRLSVLYRRHYSYYEYADGRRDNPLYRNRNLICGPGEKMCLITQCGTAGWVWRKFIDKSGQIGINCAFFRNESDILSSELILEAEVFSSRRWPGERMYTYVSGRDVKSSNPGYCYLAAGWRRLKKRTSSRQLYILEKVPA